MFDVNIYLDVARLCGAPFNRSRYNDMLISQKGIPAPHRDPRVDSARCLEIARSGMFARPQSLQAWTSAHIAATLRFKAQQEDDPSLKDEDRGLGWSPEDAQGLVDDLMWPVILGSGGDTVGDLRAEHSPPLDHEDGLVMAAAKACHDADIVVDRILVTRDRRFAELCRSLAYPKVMHPSRFVAMTHAARGRVALRGMRPPL